MLNKKLNCVLLIDDDLPTNFLNEMTLQDVNCAEHVVALQSGQDALNYLDLNKDKPETLPSLILLDLNMPKMNGWEFLENYQSLDLLEVYKPKIVVLTSSVNPDDEKIAASKPIIDDFINKPLSVDKLSKIMKIHFKD